MLEFLQGSLNKLHDRVSLSPLGVRSDVLVIARAQAAVCPKNEGLSRGGIYFNGIQDVLAVVATPINAKVACNNHIRLPRNRGFE